MTTPDPPARSSRERPDDESHDESHDGSHDELLDLAARAPPAGSDRAARIAGAVEREMSARRRMLVLFAVLLLVPLVTGVIALRSARTDHQRFVAVESTVEDVQPAIEQIRGLDTVLPRVAAASAALGKQAADVKALQENQQAIRRQLAPTEATLRELTPQLEAVRQAVASLSEVQTRLRAQDTQITRIARQQTVLQARQDSHFARVQASEDILHRLSRLEVKSDSLQGEIRSMDRMVRVSPPLRDRMIQPRVGDTVAPR